MRNWLVQRKTVGMKPNERRGERIRRCKTGWRAGRGRDNVADGRVWLLQTHVRAETVVNVKEGGICCRVNNVVITVVEMGNTERGKLSMRERGTPFFLVSK